MKEYKHTVSITATDQENLQHNYKLRIRNKTNDDVSETTPNIFSRLHSCLCNRNDLSRNHNSTFEHFIFGGLGTRNKQNFWKLEEKPQRLQARRKDRGENTIRCRY